MIPFASRHVRCVRTVSAPRRAFSALGQGRGVMAPSHRSVAPFDGLPRMPGLRRSPGAQDRTTHHWAPWLAPSGVRRSCEQLPVVSPAARRGPGSSCRSFLKRLPLSQTLVGLRISPVFAESEPGTPKPTVAPVSRSAARPRRPGPAPSQARPDSRRIGLAHPRCELARRIERRDLDLGAAEINAEPDHPGTVPQPAGASPAAQVAAGRRGRVSSAGLTGPGSRPTYRAKAGSTPTAAPAHEEADAQAPGPHAAEEWPAHPRKGSARRPADSAGRMK